MESKISSKSLRDSDKIRPQNPAPSTKNPQYFEDIFDSGI
jgi:hypothetical protein